MKLNFTTKDAKDAKEPEKGLETIVFFNGQACDQNLIDEDISAFRRKVAQGAIVSPSLYGKIIFLSRSLFVLFVLFVVSFPAFASNVQFTPLSATNTALTNIQIQITPLSNPQGNGQTDQSFTITTDASGQWTVTNLGGPCTYSARYFTTPSTFFEFYCPGDTNAYNVTNLLTNVVIVPATVAFSRQQSDLRYILESNTAPTSSLLILTNGEWQADSNFTFWSFQTLSTNATNEALFAAATQGTNSTNYTVSVSNLVYNVLVAYAGVLATNGSNWASSISASGFSGTALTNLLNAAGVNLTNLAGLYSTNSTNYAQQILAASESFTLQVGVAISNYIAGGATFSGVALTNWVGSLSTNATNEAILVAQTVATNSTNYTASQLATAETFAQALGTSITNWVNAITPGSFNGTPLTNLLNAAGLNLTNLAGAYSTNSTNFQLAVVQRPAGVPPAIFNLNFQSDWNDLSGLETGCTLHAQGKLNIQAVLINQAFGNIESVKAAYAVMAFRGCANIPIGVWTNTQFGTVTPMTNGTYPGGINWPDYVVTNFASGYPTNVGPASNVLRWALLRCPTNSALYFDEQPRTVTADLLLGPADNLSPLTTLQLFNSRVRGTNGPNGFQPPGYYTLYGDYPQGEEYNIYVDPASASWVQSHVTTGISAIGFSLGAAKLAAPDNVFQVGVYSMNSGWTNWTSPNDPAYNLMWATSTAGDTGRPAWIEATLLAAVGGVTATNGPTLIWTNLVSGSNQIYTSAHYGSNYFNTSVNNNEYYYSGLNTNALSNLVSQLNYVPQTTPTRPNLDSIRLLTGGGLSYDTSAFNGLLLWGPASADLVELDHVFYVYGPYATPADTAFLHGNLEFSEAGGGGNESIVFYGASGNGSIAGTLSNNNLIISNTATVGTFTIGQSSITSNSVPWPNYTPTPAANAFAPNANSTTLDWSLSNTQSNYMSSGSTFTFANTANGEVFSCVVSNNGSSTITWTPDAGQTIRWVGGTAPVQSANKTDVYTFIRVGATIWGTAVQGF